MSGILRTIERLGQRVVPFLGIERFVFLKFVVDGLSVAGGDVTVHDFDLTGRELLVQTQHVIGRGLTAHLRLFKLI